MSFLKRSGNYYNVFAVWQVKKSSNAQVWLTGKENIQQEIHPWQNNTDSVESTVAIVALVPSINSKSSDYTHIPLILIGLNSQKCKLIDLHWLVCLCIISFNRRKMLIYGTLLYIIFFFFTNCHKSTFRQGICMKTTANIIYIPSTIFKVYSNNIPLFPVVKLECGWKKLF